MRRVTRPFSFTAGIGVLFLGATLAAAQQSPSVIDAVDKGHAVGREKEGVEAVRAALAAGGKINKRDPSRWTPLMHACLQCRAQIVELLVENGADVNLRASGARATPFMDHGQSALTIAASCFIARRRAELAPGRGMPASYVQAELSAPQKIAGTLIRAGADVNYADAEGRTPLMMAAIQGWEEVARELLAAKARVNARDREGRLAIDYVDPQDRAIISLLRRGGSSRPSGRSGRTVCDAERALGQLGYNTPIIDCIAGQQFSATVLKFQNDHAIPPTGELDRPTLRALKIR